MVRLLLIVATGCLLSISLSTLGEQSIYRWTDQHGEIHISDTPPPQSCTSKDCKRYFYESLPDSVKKYIDKTKVISDYEEDVKRYISSWVDQYNNNFVSDSSKKQDCNDVYCNEYYSDKIKFMDYFSDDVSGIQSLGLGNVSLCKTSANISEIVMLSRKKGARKNEVKDAFIAIAGANGGSIESTHRLGIAIDYILDEVYLLPMDVYEKDEIKKSTEFKNEIFSKCTKNVYLETRNMEEKSVKNYNLDLSSVDVDEHLSSTETKIISMINCHIANHNGMRFLFLTASGETGTYAINGTARSVAGMVG